MADIEKVIRNRHSVRKYTNKVIEGKTLENLKSIIDECVEESGLNIQLVLNEENAFGKSHYGNFENCKNYIVILANKKDKDIDEKSGYYGEKIVIRAQELGLNTCWVALTYNKAEVPIEIKDNEKIVVVISIGYGVNSGIPHKGKEFKDVSKNLKDNVPDWYKRGIEFALLAPTAINQQKFKFELKNNNEVLLKVGIGPCIKIDLGIVKYHFELGAGKENFRWIK